MVLHGKRGNAMRIIAADPVARARGLRPGMALADARALAPDLTGRPFDLDAIRTGFERLADWHLYVSPLVSIAEWRAPYGDLVIDITGVPHLWGSEEALLDGVLDRLAAHGVTARGAIAPTIGAAWACARFAPGSILPDGAALEDALAPLPVAALRLDPETAQALERLGLKQIGQLEGRNRGALAARFTQALTTRLDQALGRLEERMTPRLPPPDITAERRFPEPLSLIEDIDGAIARLAVTLCERLARLGEGAQAFHLFLFRVDHEVMTLTVHAASATRDPGHISRLFAHRLETLREDFDAGFGIDIIRLGATTRARHDAPQTDLIAPSRGTDDLDRLYDRLASRLGPGAVMRPRLANSAIPERAAVLDPVFAPVSSAPLPAHLTPPRPLRLLPAPEPVDMLAVTPPGPPMHMVWRRLTHVLVRLSGPEGIGAEWWHPGASALTRDYYVAEDREGHRFWLFRDGLHTETESPRWFMHGMFP